jgi:superfamily II DNA or RNA helicase
MIWDEAHHIRAGGWTKIHESFPNCYHLGLSATPLRADGKGLCENFDYIVPGPQTYDLIKGGYLAEYDLFSCEPISDEETDRNIITVAGSLIESYIKNAEGKKAIGFAPSVYLSKQLAIKFTQNGIPAAHLDGTMNKDERKSILMRLATGEIMVVFNYNLFAEGFDISANTGMDVTVGCLIAAQKTGSLSRWLQMCGRVLRKQAGRAVINDHAGNFFLHGAPCDIRIWTLDGVKNEQETMRQCPICYYANDVVSNCVFCGYAMADERETTETGNKKLVERSDIKKIDLDMRRSFIDTATPEQLKLFEKERGYKRGWHKHILRARAEKTLLINRALSLGAKENVIYMKPKEIREVIKKYECS